MLNRLSLIAVILSAATFSRSHAADTIPLARCMPADPQTNQLTPGDIVLRLYQTVSGAAHQVRDWDVLRSFHASNGIISTSRHQDDNTFNVKIHTVEQFIELNKTLFSDRGFFETELHQKTQTLGHVAHVWSHYATRESVDAAPYAQGVNSFQFIHDGKRWCVLSATWDGDSPRHEADVKQLFGY